MEKYLNGLVLLVGIVAFSCSGNYSKIGLNKNDDYPKWLKDRNNHTNQTSGITFIGSNEGIKNFILVDDVGEFHRLTINEDELLTLNNIKIVGRAKEFLSKYPKKDFEEVTYDKYTGDLLLSIEGNGSNYKKYNAIVKVKFSGNNIYSGDIINFEKINVEPQALFMENLYNNIGYEGLAVDSKYCYLGLEVLGELPILSMGSIIFVVDKVQYKIIQTINTEEYGIHSICGLSAEDERKIIGVDRNSRKLFYLELDDSLKVIYAETNDIPVNIPGYPKLAYSASLESVTLDDEKNIYLIDDPWKKFFIPEEKILDNLDESTIENFREFIPILFKFDFRLKN